MIGMPASPEDADRQGLAEQILTRAYPLAPAMFDRVAARLGSATWPDLTRNLTWLDWDSGGGCRMLIAALPGGHALQLTDGETGLPSTPDTFCIGVTDPDGDELAWVFSDGGSGGLLSGTERP